MVRRLLGGDARVAVILRVRRREVAAVKVVVVFLLAVIGQRAPSRLASADAAPVRERGEEDRVHLAEPLEVVEDGVHAFIDERHRAGLDADHRRVSGKGSRARERVRERGRIAKSDAACGERGRFEERATIHLHLECGERRR